VNKRQFNLTLAMSGGIIDEEYNIFTVPNPALIGPLTDKIDIREGTFEVVNVTGTFTTVDIAATTITVTNANITNLNVAALSVANLGANAISPSPAGSGVSVDGVVIRDRAHYAVANRSVACFEGANPASTAGVSVALIPYFTGALIAAFPDGTALGGDTRGDNAVDWQMVRSTPDQVAGALCSTIGGGSDCAITIGGNYCTIGGGVGNSINNGVGFTADNCTIGGGIGNAINAIAVNSPNNVICGGQGNSITNAFGSSIVGAQSGSILSNNGSFIGGGSLNQINGAGDSCVITGGSTNNIVGGLKNGILCGSLHTVAASDNAAIVGGLQNTINGSSLTVVGGQQNTVINSAGSVAFGVGNTIQGGSGLSCAIGNYNEVTGPFSLAMGYNARSVSGFMSHTFCATELSGGANTNVRQRSHKFVDDIFEVFSTGREIHNNNTQYFYQNTVTAGPQNPHNFMWIFIEPYSCVTTFIHITGGGGNEQKTALGYGYTRCFWRPAGVLGTNWFNNSASEDGGFGYNTDIVYSGYYMGIRIFCGVGPGVLCNWTACVQMQKATWLF
jgi:hypothetical protein